MGFNSAFKGLIFTLGVCLEMQINLRAGINKCGQCSETPPGTSFFGDYGVMCAMK